MESDASLEDSNDYTSQIDSNKDYILTLKDPAIHVRYVHHFFLPIILQFVFLYYYFKLLGLEFPSWLVGFCESCLK